MNSYLNDKNLKSKMVLKGIRIFIFYNIKITLFDTTNNNVLTEVALRSTIGYINIESLTCLFKYFVFLI